jgi:heme A synthase
MDTLASIHGYLARVLLIFAVVLALWGTYLYFRNRRVSGGFRSSYLIMAGVTALQGLLGLGALVLGGDPHGHLLHFVYGAFAVLFLPGAYLYSHGGTTRRETLIMAAASWIVAIAYLRGISTG